MNLKPKIPELLSPAGNFEKMKAALHYGADAVYLSGKSFGMRSAADNFTLEELFLATKYAHSLGKKIYLTVNTMPHANEYDQLRNYLHSLKGCGIDAMIVADLGVMNEIKTILPQMDIHVSTQAGIVSPESALAYVSLGAKRVVLARELTLDEIKGIRSRLPDTVEIEAFVHGSMCVSYSGRCLLSQYLTGRDANRGGCTQPCRWNYSIVEEKRPDLPLPIEENKLGTFIMSSKDMCTISIIPQLIEAGISSFKIEGRMKSAYYTALVTNAYRIAMNSYQRDPSTYVFDESLLLELDSVSHREYCTGYYLDLPQNESNICKTTGYIRDKAFFAVVPEDMDAYPIPDNLEIENEKGKLYLFEQRNKVCKGDYAQIISPLKVGQTFKVEEIYSDKGIPLDSAPHPAMKFFVRVPFEVYPYDIMRSYD